MCGMCDNMSLSSATSNVRFWLPILVDRFVQLQPIPGRCGEFLTKFRKILLNENWKNHVKPSLHLHAKKMKFLQWHWGSSMQPIWTNPSPKSLFWRFYTIIVLLNNHPIGWRESWNDFFACYCIVFNWPSIVLHTKKNTMTNLIRSMCVRPHVNDEIRSKIIRKVVPESNGRSNAS